MSLHRQQLSLAGVGLEGEGQGGAGGVALQAEWAAGENQEQQQVEEPSESMMGTTSRNLAGQPVQNQHLDLNVQL